MPTLPPAHNGRLMKFPWTVSEWHLSVILRLAALFEKHRIGSQIFCGKRVSMTVLSKFFRIFEWFIFEFEFILKTRFLVLFSIIFSSISYLNNRIRIFKYEWKSKNIIRMPIQIGHSSTAILDRWKITETVAFQCESLRRKRHLEWRCSGQKLTCKVLGLQL